MKQTPNSSMPLADALEKLRYAADSNFEQAHPLPAGLNHSTEFFTHEQQSIFLQEWICVGREDEVANHGDYLTQEIASVPVIVIRQENQELGAFVNACAHRFACLMPDANGNAKRLTCRYHAWTYDTFGQLIRAPHMEMKQGFETSEHKLRPIHLEIWEGFIYVTLAEKPATRLSDILAPFRDKIVGRFDMACYRTIIRETMDWDANWKNLIENFTESYHVPVAHGKTFAQHKKTLSDYICGEDSDYYGYHHAVQPEHSGPGAAHPANNRLSGEWRRMMIDFCIFPCHLVTLMPDYLWYISVQPLSANRMRANWSVAVPPEVLNDISDADYDNWLNQFKDYMTIANDEDKPLVEALHQGTGSPILPTGTYHSIERNLWQFTRYLSRVCSDK